MENSENLSVQIPSEIKERAEEILQRLGIPVSLFIESTYKQVILKNGVPFPVNIPDTVTKDKFD